MEFDRVFQPIIMGNDRLISRWPARGGAVVIDDTVYFAAGIWQSDGVFIHALDAKTGDLASRLGLGAEVALASGIVQAEGRSLAQYRWKDQQTRDREGDPINKRLLEKIRLIDCEHEVLEFIIAGIYSILGEEGRVSMVDYAAQRNTVWSHKVEGRALGLAFGNGRLVVSTDKGYIYCFDEHAHSLTDQLFTHRKGPGI